MKRRSLVITDESARHPFLASLPPHVRSAAQPMALRRGWRLEARDWRDFLAAYCASFVAVMMFIA